MAALCSRYHVRLACAIIRHPWASLAIRPNMPAVAHSGLVVMHAALREADLPTVPVIASESPACHPHTEALLVCVGLCCAHNI